MGDELLRLAVTVIGGSAALAAIWDVRPKGWRALWQAVAMTAVLLIAVLAATRG